MEIIREELIMEYLTDKDGKWKLRKDKKYQLIEPSQAYIDANTPTQGQIDNETNKQLIKEMEQEQLGLIRLIEDMAEYLENNT
jgi:hypothetical protein